MYCTYEIPRIKGTKDPDKLVHDMIQAINSELRITQNREFFELPPWAAYEMLKAIATIHGRADKVVRNLDNKIGEEEACDTGYSVEALYPDYQNKNSLYNKLKLILSEIDSSLVETPNKLYVAFKKGKNNVVSLWPRSSFIEVVLNAKLGTIKDEYGLTYDISNRKWTSNQYALKFYDDTDVNQVKDILKQVYSLK